MTTHLTMARVIQLGASRREAPKPCAHCGADAPLASESRGRFYIICQNEDCPVDVQAWGSTLAEVWAKWNARS